MKITWYDYEFYIDKLVEKIDDDFDHILCVGRGGFMIGDALSRILKIPIAVIMAKSYENYSQKILRFSNIAFLDKFCGKILIVDDLVDSGKTLMAIKSKLEKNQKREEITKISTAVIWRKSSTLFHPDYYVEDLDKDTWVEQPFETFGEKR